jgi:hypothetical protein
MFDQVFDCIYPHKHPWMHERREGRWKIYSFNPPRIDNFTKVLYEGFRLPELKNSSHGISIDDIVTCHSYTLEHELFHWEKKKCLVEHC